MNNVIKTYSFKIRHSKKYTAWIESTLGATRFIYNLAKETKEESYKKGLKLSAFDLSNQFTQCKKEKGFEWLKNIPSQTSQGIIERMDNSFMRFFKGAGYPKWASKRKWKSIPFKEIKQIHNNFFKLPKLGIVKVFNPKLIKGKLKTAQIVKECDGYYLKIQVEVEKIQFKKDHKDLGIDRGLTQFIVTSDSEFIENPRINIREEKKLRVLNRKLSRAKKDSKGRLKIINQLQKLYLKRKRQRLDFLHKLTTKLGNKYSIIYLENLKVGKMIQDKNYSKGISDVGWYKFEELLGYKTKVIKINPSYTSQECSKCNYIHRGNRLTQSEFNCIKCGHKENADLNASKIILTRGRAVLYNININH